MLPKTVVRQLKYGHSIRPEQFECVTLSFIEISNYHDLGMFVLGFIFKNHTSFRVLKRSICSKMQANFYAYIFGAVS